MKIRSGFVSNSSSASFVIGKYYLSSEQIDMINNHIEEGKKHPHLDNLDCESEDQWSIFEDDNTISGSVYMDTFDMETFLSKIVGIDKDKVKWSW